MEMQNSESTAAPFNASGGVWPDRDENPESRRGNPNCVLCSRLHAPIFGRCRYCTVSSISQCVTVKIGVLLLAVTILLGVLADVVGGDIGRMVFIVTGLGTVATLMIINVANNLRARTRRRLVQLHHELAEQHEFLKELSPLGSLSECAEHIVRSACARLRCKRVSVMLADENHENLYIVAASGLSEDVIRKTRIPIGQRVSGRVFQGEKPVHMHNAKARTISSLPIESESFMSGPLMLSGMRWGNARIGVLSVTEPIGRKDFDIDDEFVFSNICGASAVAIYNHMAVAQVRQSNVEFLEALVNAIEARDKYTRGHSERVSTYSMAIAKRLLLSEDTVAAARMGGRLHDIGKIGMTDAILWKDGAPTEEEWNVIRRHPDIGADMLANASLVSSALDGIRCHHERLDGSGYPHALAGADIPLVGRIVGVADAFDAMTTARPYHEPLSDEEALAELRRCRHTTLDGASVDALADAVLSGELSDVRKADAHCINS